MPKDAITLAMMTATIMQRLLPPVPAGTAGYDEAMIEKSINYALYVSNEIYETVEAQVAREAEAGIVVAPSSD